MTMDLARAAVENVKYLNVKQQILQCFFDADLRNGHDGLAAIAKKKKIDVTKLEPGRYIVFVNSSKDKIKMYAASNVVAYYKCRAGEKLNLLAIREIPKSFTASGQIDYDSALKIAIEKALARRARRKAEV